MYITVTNIIQAYFAHVVFFVLEDYTESVEALEGAIHVLERQAHDRKQADSRREQLAAFQMADHPAESADQQADSFAQISALKHSRLIPQETLLK